MLAEIFLVRLQNLLRTNALNESTSGRRDPRFVPDAEAAAARRPLTPADSPSSRLKIGAAEPIRRFAPH